MVGGGQWSTENLGQLAACLTALRARLKVGDGSIDRLGIEIDARTIHNIEIGAWPHHRGRRGRTAGHPRRGLTDRVYGITVVRGRGA